MLFLWLADFRSHSFWKTVAVALNCVFAAAFGLAYGLTDLRPSGIGWWWLSITLISLPLAAYGFVVLYWPKRREDTMWGADSAFVLMLDAAMGWVGLSYLWLLVAVLEARHFIQGGPGGKAGRGGKKSRDEHLAPSSHGNNYHKLVLQPAYTRRS